MEKKFRIKEQSITDKNATLVLENVRLAFVYIAKPNDKFSADGRAASYQVSCLFPKDSDLDLFERILTTLSKTSPVFSSTTERTAGLKNMLKIHETGSLLKDGDKTTNKDGQIYDGFENNFFIKAKTNAVFSDGVYKPKIGFKLVRWDKSEIKHDEIENEIYAGCWANVMITLSPYKSPLGSGVTVYLGGIQKTYDDTRFGGLDPFEVVEIEGSFDDDRTPVESL